MDPNVSYLCAITHILFFSSSQTSYSHNFLFSCHFHVIFTPLPKIFTTPSAPLCRCWGRGRVQVRFRLPPCSLGLHRITLLYRIGYLQFVFFKALNHVGPRPGLGLCLHVGFALLTLPLASPLCWVGSGFGSSSRLRPSLRKHKQNLTMKITK